MENIFSEETLRRGTLLWATGAVKRIHVSSRSFLAYVSSGSREDVIHTVYITPGSAVCSCIAGLSGKPCSHVVAALLELEAFNSF